MISEATLKSWYEDNASSFPLGGKCDGARVSIAFSSARWSITASPRRCWKARPPSSRTTPFMSASVVITTTDVTVTVSAGVTGAIDVARMTTTMTDLFANDGESEGYELAPLAVDDENLIGVVGRVYLGPCWSHPDTGWCICDGL